MHLEIDVSIDGFAETHDRIRGVPGNFEKALETLAALEMFKDQWPNFTIYINSVITRENRNQIVELGHYFTQNANLDGHYFQIIRGDPKDRNLQHVDPKELKEIYQQVLPLNFGYLSKTQRKKSTMDGVRGAYWKAGYVFSYRTQYANYVNGTKWKMPCTAGQTSIVIDYNGDIRVCELRKPIGNLRKCEMDFQRFWNSIERKREVQQVEHDKCFCTHICFMYDSMRHSRRVMLWELPSLYLGHLFGNLLRPLQRGKTQQTAKIGQIVPAVVTQLPSTDNMPTCEMQA